MNRSLLLAAAYALGASLPRGTSHPGPRWVPAPRFIKYHGQERAHLIGANCAEGEAMRRALADRPIAHPFSFPS